MINSWDVVDSIRDCVEDYGQACYDDGYEEGLSDREDGLGPITLQDAILKEKGFIKRTHNYNGQIVHVWIEGPDFNG